jgi:hypothetical protein
MRLCHVCFDLAEILLWFALRQSRVLLPAGGVRIFDPWESLRFTQGLTLALAALHTIAVIPIGSVSDGRQPEVPMRLHQVVAAGLGERRSRRNGAEQEDNRKDGREFAEHLGFSFQS